MIGDIDCCTCDGELTINDVSMHTHAWCVTDLLDLYLSPAFRGDNLVIPGAAGQLPFPKRVDETRYPLPMVITGIVDMDGVPFSNPYIGLQNNIDYLMTNVVLPPTAPTATRAASLVLPDTSVVTANVQVTSLRRGQRAGPMILAVLELTVPAGRFE